MNKTIQTLIAQRLSRRQVMQAGLGSLLALAIPAGKSETRSSAQTALLGFRPVPAAILKDEVCVPEGYSAEVFYRWGDPVSDGPAFKMDASNTAQEQAQQAGMHHDALQYFALDDDSTHGLLVMNHEYIDPQILHPADGGYLDDPTHYTREKMYKEQAAHGISIIEIRSHAGTWHIVRPSAYARRITARTAIDIAGPAAGHVLMQTRADPTGRRVLGTFNNCANGQTPWGTYLSCEENVNDYFFLPADQAVSERQRARLARYDIAASYYGWHMFDDRFNVAHHPHEPNRFGWVVECDPRHPTVSPVKRTALGRFCHENVAIKVGKDRRIACYCGDDSKFEYVYKYISQDSWDGTQGMAHGRLLDQGTLYVAQFYEDGTGRWLPLRWGQSGLTPDDGFDDQADVLIHARLAADKLGATPMDRPEWITVHPQTDDVYISMTNNHQRGKPGHPDKDAANPRNDNRFGHIIRLREADASSTVFEWDIVLLAGKHEQGGTIQGDLFANPDGLMVDPRGVLWVQTDISSSKLNRSDYAAFGNNQMLAIDPVTGECRRFLTGPVGCEITGMAMSPDLSTLWVNIQHPGEQETIPGSSIKKSARHPGATSLWPDHKQGGRPRSATVMIRREDGGIIGG